MSRPGFREIDWRSFKENCSELLSERWMLITPGIPGRWNAMTASWGGFGHVWNMDAAFVFVRPSRHSYGFMEREEGFTLSFFGPEGRKALNICGSRSGRNTNKAEAAGITPRSFAASGGEAGRPAPERVGFEEAHTVVSCRKVFAQDLAPSSFVDPSILPENYPKGDLHRLYAGAIEGAWTRDQG
jgi:flavin reductase (DIM6/NTAB) family NADH-FMN oxidoreductase RutF